MGINIRTKGAGGERELATLLNEIVKEVLIGEGYDVPEKPIVQRNQNQSAVGGSDLCNTFGYAIEVKRHETLAVNTWWKQSVVASKEFGGTPVVIYRKNKQKWNVVLFTFAPVWGSANYVQVRSEIPFEDFCKVFKETVITHLRTGKWNPSDV